MRCPPQSRGVLLTAGLSVLSVVVSSFLIRRGVVTGAMRPLVALAPVPFFVAFVVAEVKWVRSCDEFHRNVILESLAIAFPSAITLAVLVEAVQKAGYLGDMTVGRLWPLMALCWVPSLMWAVRRYR
jgi:hypothetical protein